MSKSTVNDLITAGLRALVIAIALIGGAHSASVIAEQIVIMPVAIAAKAADAAAAKPEGPAADANAPPAQPAQHADENQAAKPVAVNIKMRPAGKPEKAANAAAKPAEPDPQQPRVTRVFPKRIAPAPAPNLMPVVANQNAAEPQIRARLELMLKAELSFATRAAGLSDDERRTVIAASNKWLDGFVVEFSKQQDPNQRQMWLQGVHVIGGPRTGDDPCESIQRGVAKVMANTLPQDKVEAYAAECRKRDDFYREVTVDNLVERIDEKVILSSEQRQRLVASLNEHWDPSWAPQLEIFVADTNMWPKVPDQWVSPELTPAQRSVLGGFNKNAGPIYRSGQALGMDGGVIDDIDLHDVPSQADHAQTE